MGSNRGTGFLNTFKSVLAAAIGVQSRRNRERDFEQGKPIHFIVAGIFFTILFIVSLAVLVNWLIASSN